MVGIKCFHLLLMRGIRLNTYFPLQICNRTPLTRPSLSRTTFCISELSTTVSIFYNQKIYINIITIIIINMVFDHFLQTSIYHAPISLLRITLTKERITLSNYNYSLIFFTPYLHLQGRRPPPHFVFCLPSKHVR